MTSGVRVNFKESDSETGFAWSSSFDPENVKESLIVKVWRQADSGNKVKLTSPQVRWIGIEGISFEVLNKLYLQKGGLEKKVTCLENGEYSFTIRFVRGDSAPVIAQPSLHRSPSSLKVNLLTVQTASQLKELNEQERADPLLSGVYEGMIHSLRLDKGEIAEVVAVIPYLSFQQIVLLIEKIVCLLHKEADEDRLAELVNSISFIRPVAWERSKEMAENEVAQKLNHLLARLASQPLSAAALNVMAFLIEFSLAKKVNLNEQKIKQSIERARFNAFPRPLSVLLYIKELLVRLGMSSLSDSISTTSDSIGIRNLLDCRLNFLFYKSESSSLPESTQSMLDSFQEDRLSMLTEVIRFLGDLIATYQEINPDLVEKAIRRLGDVAVQATSIPYKMLRERAIATLDFLYLYSNHTLRKPIELELRRLNSQTPTLIHLSTSTYFLTTLEHVAPFVKKLKLAREKYLDLKTREMNSYFVDLKSENETSEKLKERLDTLKANKENRLILIVGDTGSGKTIFIQHLTIDYFNHFLSNTPIVLTVSLSSLKNPEQDLISETLERYGFSREERAWLKTRPTVWLCDGFDEIFLGREKRKFNFFKKNNLGDWKEALFIVTSRKEFFANAKEIEEYFRFDPCLSVPQLSIAPFEYELDVETFLTKFVDVKKELWKQKRLPIWTVDQYLHVILCLELSVVIKNPLMLRVVAETLPLLPEEDQKDMKNTQANILDEWIYRSIMDECGRFQTRGIRLIEPLDYLLFFIKLSRYMEICDRRSIGENELDLLENGSKIYIDKQNREIEQIKGELERIRLSRGVSGSVLKSSACNVANAIDNHKDVLKVQADMPDMRLRKANIREALQAPRELIKMLFGKEYFDLRRSGFLIMQGDRKEFMHILIYLHFRSLDTLDYTKTSLGQRLQQS